MRMLAIILLVSLSAATGRAESLLAHARSELVPGPVGWQRWCRTNLADCLPGGPAVLLQGDASALLAAAKAEVDGRLARRSDPVGDDQWREDVGYGDCEDFALAYRRELIRLGAPRGALRLVVADTEQGVRHAVLAVETGSDTQILDVRQPQPLSWRALDYQWLGIEDGELPLWRLLVTS